MDRIQAMGMDLIWLMPIHPLGEVKSKGSLGSPYSIRDYYAVNSDFGTVEDLKELVAEIHDRGMHVLLDFALNHSSWDNQMIIDHPEWYTKDSLGNIISPVEDWSDVAGFLLRICFTLV